MKKIISLLLAVLMIFSCATAAFAAGSEGTEETESTTKKDLNETLAEKIGVDFTNALNNPDLASLVPDAFTDANDDQDFDALMTSGKMSDAAFLGLSIDFIYKSSDPLIWSNVSVGQSDLALIYGNIDTYLGRLMKSKIRVFDFYTSAHATAICNYVGKLINPAYTNTNISFNTNPTTSEEFYDTISERSGLTDWLDEVWTPYGDTLSYVAFITTLGVDLNDFLVPTKDIEKGEEVGPMLIKSIIEKSTLIGPIQYLIQVIRTFALTYDYYLYPVVKALFRKHIEAGNISSEELKSFKGLLNMFFNQNKKDNSKLQMITPPLYRIATAKSDTEVFLYILAYCNLVGIYKNNPTVINNLKAYINRTNNLDAGQKERVISIISVLFEGKFIEFQPMLQQLAFENLSETGTIVKNHIFGFFGRIIDAIVGFFDKLFRAIRINL